MKLSLWILEPILRPHEERPQWMRCHMETETTWRRIKVFQFHSSNKVPNIEREATCNLPVPAKPSQIDTTWNISKSSPKSPEYPTHRTISNQKVTGLSHYITFYLFICFFFFCAVVNNWYEDNLVWFQWNIFLWFSVTSIYCFLSMCSTGLKE